ncbi:helix-turn-helix transcriptional regulator [Qipengyuania sphaerica]|uniref:helix-turn-helix transcriptional regulator n=1 Tax=Qipengyuania sphaerica TaxID=2867243 RepID=UPI001C881927|nr:hypothetical protein [Qipengyuania sphaerica]MBX7539724.1 hypothetical protein [Qipengyuania sphaerica]
MRSEEIYDALFDDEAFAHLPGKLASIAGGRSAVVGWVYTDGAQRFLGHNGYFAESDIESYLRDYAAEDPWTLSNLSNFRANVLIDNAELVSDERYSKSRLYNEFFRKIGDDTFRALSISGSSPHGKGSLAIHRGKSSQGFSTAGKRALARIAPHVGRAVALRAQLAQLESSRELAGALADASPVATLIVDSKRRLLRANAAGEALLQASSLFIVKWGRIGIVGKSARAIEDGLARATSPSPAPALIAIAREDDVPLTLDILPMPIDATTRGAMLVVRDPSAMSPDTPARLSGLFGLSSAQAAVAMGLAEGRTIEQMAKVRGVSRETIKVQVRDAAARLGCTRQAEIAAVVRAIGVLSKNAG